MFSGIAYFERNMANFGGAMCLRGNSKLILKPKLNMHFILNHANESGGALHFPDSQCTYGSLEPIACFIAIYSPYASADNISLCFVNNSADFTGSVLYGGDFDICRLYIFLAQKLPNLLC